MLQVSKIVRFNMYFQGAIISNKLEFPILHREISDTSLTLIHMVKKMVVNGTQRLVITLLKFYHTAIFWACSINFTFSQFISLRFILYYSHFYAYFSQGVSSKFFHQKFAHLSCKPKVWPTRYQAHHHIINIQPFNLHKTPVLP